MNFKIVVEDKKKGKIIIPLPKEKIRDLFDIVYMIPCSDAWDTIKLNNMDSTFKWFNKITDHLVIDIMDGGVFFEGSKATKKFKAVRKGIHYMTKRPQWRKF